MRVIKLLLLFLFVSGSAIAQNDTTKYFKSNDYGWKYQRLKPYMLILPTDTTVNKLGFATRNEVLYLGNGTYWTSAGGSGGGSTDTTALSNRINLKADKATTLTINGTAFDLSANRSWDVGTLTSFSRTNGLGIIATVTNPTTLPNIDIAIDTSDASILSRQRAANTYQPIITNPVTGTGTGITNYLPKWSTSSALNNSLFFDNGTSVGLGTALPTALFHIAQATPASVGTTTVTATAAPLKIIGGNGGATSSSGAVVTAGASGAVAITTGNGGSITGTPITGIGGAAGEIRLLGGDGGLGTTFGGQGGNVEIAGGTGGGGTNGGTPGYASIKAGNAGSTGNAAGGNVYVVPGIGNGSGGSGSIFLGLSPASTVRGNVVIGSSLDDYSNKLQVTGHVNLSGLSTGIPSGAKRLLIGSDNQVYAADTTSGGGGGGVTTMAAIGSSANANGATISGTTLNLEPASASFGGVVTTGAQTFAGNKNFSGTTTLATPFTLGATSVTTTGTQLNYLNAATGTTGTTSSNVVYSASPTLATPTFTTSATTPLLIGGTGTTSTLTLQSTSGSGTTGSNIIFQDNNTEWMRIINAGRVGIGTTTPGTVNGTTFSSLGLHVKSTAGSGYVASEANGPAGMVLNDNSQVADSRLWGFANSSTNFVVAKYTDAGVPTNILTITRGNRVGINNTSPDLSSVLDVSSTVAGFLPPRMTATQKNAISSPAEGLIVYDTTLHKLCVYTGSAWETITSL